MKSQMAKTKLLQYSKLLLFSALTIALLTAQIWLREEKREHAHLNSYRGYEFLGKIESIKTGAEIIVELINLNPGAQLKKEEIKLCINESLVDVFNAEQTLRVLWLAKDSGKLVRISYPSHWHKCLSSVKIVEPN